MIGQTTKTDQTKPQKKVGLVALGLCVFTIANGALFLYQLNQKDSSFHTKEHVASDDKTKDFNDFLSKNQVEVFASQDIDYLHNVNLESLITNAGPVYVDRQKGIIIKGEVLSTNGENDSLETLNKPLISKFVGSLPNKIIAKAPNEKLVVDVFTDTTCGWCQKLHEHLNDYLKRGITLRFILYPREGLNGQQKVANKMTSILKSNNQLETLQSVQHGSYIPPSQEVSPTIIDNVKVANGIGVTGTPTLVIDGTIIGGYLPADQIEASFIKNGR